MASESNGVHALMHKFLGLLRNYREPVTDAEVREYFQAEGQGEYEKLPSVLNVLMSEVRNHQTKHAALDDCMSWVPAVRAACSRADCVVATLGQDQDFPKGECAFLRRDRC